MNIFDDLNAKATPSYLTRPAVDLSTQMTHSEFTDTMCEAKLVVTILEKFGYVSSIIGGALRVAALGGTTQDVDIAVLVDGVEGLSTLEKEVDQILNNIPWCGEEFQYSHARSYSDSDGFLADWRSGKINLIAYNTNCYPTIKSLVDQFDLTINQWYVSPTTGVTNDHLKYDYGTPVVEVNPKRDCQGHTLRLSDRIQRFKLIYPHFNWSKVDVLLNRDGVLV